MSNLFVPFFVPFFVLYGRVRVCNSRYTLSQTGGTDIEQEGELDSVEQRLVSTAALLKMTRLLRLARLGGKYHKSMIGGFTGYGKMLRFQFLFVAIAHVFGCFYYFIASIGSEDPTQSTLWQVTWRVRRVRCVRRMCLVACVRVGREGREGCRVELKRRVV